MQESLLYRPGSAVVPRCVRRGSVQKPHVHVPYIDDPVLQYNFARRTNTAGNPLWICTGRKGSVADAVGAGGAANPTALGSYPGYSFDGGDHFTTVSSITGDWTIDFVWTPTIAALIYPFGIVPPNNWGILYTGFTTLTMGFYDGVTVLSGIVPRAVGTKMRCTITKAGGTLYTIYIDGVAGVSGTRTDRAITNLMVGQRGDGFGDITGSIEALSVYDFALPATVIRARHEANRHIHAM